MAANVPDCAERSLVRGHMWGEDTAMLHDARNEFERGAGREETEGFDVILVADCLYWRSVHR